MKSIGIQSKKEKSPLLSRLTILGENPTPEEGKEREHKLCPH